MKVLLDENLPHDLRLFLPVHEVFTVACMGWASLENGQLLRAAADAGFDVMLTKDTGLEHEQYLPQLPLAVLVLRAGTNKLEDILPILPEVLSVLALIQPGQLVRVGK